MLDRCSQCKMKYRPRNPKGVSFPMRFALVGKDGNIGKIQEIGKKGESLCKKCTLVLLKGIKKMGMKIKEDQRLSQ